MRQIFSGIFLDNYDTFSTILLILLIVSFGIGVFVGLN